MSSAYSPYVTRGYRVGQLSFRLKTQVLSLPVFSLFCQFALTLFERMSFLFCCMHSVTASCLLWNIDRGRGDRVKQGVITAGKCPVFL